MLQASDPSAMTLGVREMTSADIEAVAALCGELGYPSSPQQVNARFCRLQGRAGHRVLVADDRGLVVGWIHVALTMTLESDQKAEILGLVVGDGCRSRGIGLLLLREAERWACAQGCRQVRLRSNVIRTDAHRFYGRHGYRVVKTQLALEKTIES